MANPNPAPGRKFKKGEVNNPRGAGAHNKAVKEIKRMTQDDVADIGALIIRGNVEELKRIMAKADQPDSTISVLKVWFCSVAIKAIQKGDAQALNALLDRIVGRVKEKVELQASVEATTVKVDYEQLKALRDKFNEEY